MNMNFIVFYLNKSGNSFSFRIVFLFFLLQVKVAEWNDNGGLQPLNAKYVRLRPHVEFEKNRTYIVTTVLEEPYIMIKQPAFGEKLHGNERFEGYCKDLADLLSKKLGLECKLKKMLPDIHAYIYMERQISMAAV